MRLMYKHSQCPTVVCIRQGISIDSVVQDCRSYTNFVVAKFLCGKYLTQRQFLIQGLSLTHLHLLLTMPDINFNSLEDRAIDVDPDIRFMALEDLRKFLTDDTITISRTAINQSLNNMIPTLLKMLNDPSRCSKPSS